MKECNVCAVKNCRISKELNMFRNGEIHISAAEMQASCSSYEPLQPLKTSVFILTMFINPQGVYDTLANLKMKVIDNRKAPYFKIVSQFQREKKKVKRWR